MRTEQQALEHNRYELAARLGDESYPEAAKEEMLDALCAIDRGLGATALFVVDREAYQVPPVRQHSDGEPVMMQESTLF